MWPVQPHKALHPSTYHAYVPTYSTCQHHQAAAGKPSRSSAPVLGSQERLWGTFCFWSCNGPVAPMVRRPCPWYKTIALSASAKRNMRRVISVGCHKSSCTKNVQCYTEVAKEEEIVIRVTLDAQPLNSSPRSSPILAAKEKNWGTLDALCRVQREISQAGQGANPLWPLSHFLLSLSHSHSLSLSHSHSHSLSLTCQKKWGGSGEVGDQGASQWDADSEGS